MRTGDNVRDVYGNSYSVGQLLGSGAWARSWLVRREGSADETLLVLKTPLQIEDVRALADPEGAMAASREAVQEGARVLEHNAGGSFPKLLGRVGLPDGSPAYLVPYYASTLEQRIRDGLGVTGLLDALLGAVKALRGLATSSVAFHGNLRPSNVALDERGGVMLLDPIGPTTRGLWSRLPSAGHPGIPPEVAAGAGFNQAVDAYALTAILLRAALGDDPLPPYAREGLGKSAAAHLKNRVMDRLKLEDSNPRFHQRLADRVAALVARGLSREPNPSPPFRFARLDELQSRVEELQALVRPVANAVGKILLDRLPSQSWFLTDEAVVFSCTVGCSTGVEAHEEVGVGIAVFDQDRSLRLKDLDLGYTAEKHPSGRFKFSFRVNGLQPGRYLLRLAFAVRDSGQPPVTAETEAVVRPAPGWVPPAEAPPSAPLRFDARAEADALRDPPAAIPATPAAPLPVGFAPPIVTPPPPAAESRLRPGGTPGSTQRDPEAVATLAPEVPIARAAAALKADELREHPSGPRRLDVAPRVEPPGPEQPRLEPPRGPAPEQRFNVPDPQVRGAAVALPSPVPPRPVPPRVEGDSKLDLRPEPGVADSRPARVEPAAPTSPPAVPSQSSARPRTSAPATPADVRFEETPPPEPRRRDWTAEPLPGTSAPAGFEEGNTNADNDEDDEPGLLARIVDQIKNDSYLLVATTLIGVILLLLIALFVVQS